MVSCPWPRQLSPFTAEGCLLQIPEIQAEGLFPQQGQRVNAVGRRPQARPDGDLGINAYLPSLGWETWKRHSTPSQSSPGRTALQPSTVSNSLKNTFTVSTGLISFRPLSHFPTCQPVCLGTQPFVPTKETTCPQLLVSGSAPEACITPSAIPALCTRRSRPGHHPPLLYAFSVSFPWERLLQIHQAGIVAVPALTNVC